MLTCAQLHFGLELRFLGSAKVEVRLRPLPIAPDGSGQVIQAPSVRHVRRAAAAAACEDSGRSVSIDVGPCNEPVVPAAGRSSLPELQHAGSACHGSWAVEQLACGSPGGNNPEYCLCGEGASIPEWREASLIECQPEGACSECTWPELAPNWLLSWFSLCWGPRGLHSTVLNSQLPARHALYCRSRELAAEPHCGGKQSRRQSSQPGANIQTVQTSLVPACQGDGARLNLRYGRGSKPSAPRVNCTGIGGPSLQIGADREVTSPGWSTPADDDGPSSPSRLPLALPRSSWSLCCASAPLPA